MRKMIQVNVTKLDIKRGETGSARTCPVARAIRRAIKVKRASNKDESIKTYSFGVRIGSKMSKSVFFRDHTSKKRAFNLKKFVSDFDAGLPVEPCKLFLVCD